MSTSGKRPEFIRGVPAKEYYRIWGAEKWRRKRTALKAREPNGREFLFRWLNSPVYPCSWPTTRKRLIAVYHGERLIGAFDSPRERGEFFDGKRLDHRRSSTWASKFTKWRKAGKPRPFHIKVHHLVFDVYCWEGKDYPEDD